VTNLLGVASPTSPLAGRAAIVHDWFQGYHGAERVADEMRIGLFAQEPGIYTFMAARELLPPELAGSILKESRLARLPGIRQRGHAPGRWRAFDEAGAHRQAPSAPACTHSRRHA